jgi:hypothetical protein
VKARDFADEHNFRVGVARTRDSVGRPFVKFTFCTIFDLAGYGAQGGGTVICHWLILL